MMARDHGAAETYLSDDGFTTTDRGGTTPGGILGDPILARPGLPETRLPHAAPRRRVPEAAMRLTGPAPEFIATFMARQHDHRTSIAGRVSEDFPYDPTCILARYAHA